MTTIFSKLIDLKTLSKIIHKAESSIRSDLIRKPDSLPPRFNNSGKLLWHIDDVNKWLEDRRGYQQDKESSNAKA